MFPFILNFKNSSFQAFSLAASMFESNSVENENLSETNTELYILGVKYTTPNGEL